MSTMSNSIDQGQPVARYAGPSLKAVPTWVERWSAWAKAELFSRVQLEKQKVSMSRTRKLWYLLETISIDVKKGIWLELNTVQKVQCRRKKSNAHSFLEWQSIHLAGCWGRWLWMTVVGECMCCWVLRLSSKCMCMCWLLWWLRWLSEGRHKVDGQ